MLCNTYLFRAKIFKALFVYLFVFSSQFHSHMNAYILLILQIQYLQKKEGQTDRQQSHSICAVFYQMEEHNKEQKDNVIHAAEKEQQEYWISDLHYKIIVGIFGCGLAAGLTVGTVTILYSLFNPG
ncbi:transmembrane protein, putative (macronuclear) [Tetrahymena thermophila SB210]|uniref:Transmembrane protein, putative n=1 Tax=Tetrahymena thermophila (strain SB210) TaxID=312017 RepID=Q22RA3_TETTS|nr:transmembrane protein, putative [Tetrahymena thermophila SB210]EAR88219.2 transmembrane protein, putative [Tetrahymena thermophila SB210]|eukprot:XP_001008464.2 transmembrane protein, putative [Tetrahymena thermophila SB210]